MIGLRSGGFVIAVVVVVVVAVAVVVVVGGFPSCSGSRAHLMLR